MAAKSGKSGGKSAGKSSGPVVSNKKAYHDYLVLEKFTAGLVLTGTEVKSIRNGKVSMNQSFCRIVGDELWLHGLHISPYEQGNQFNHDPDRTRKLLMQKKEISKLAGKIQQSGLTLIPLKIFFSRCWVKVELGLCRGKKQHDKREAIAERDAKRQMDRAMKQRR